MPAHALDIIRAEHRALASVLQALRHIARGIRDESRAPDYRLLHLMVDYIEGFQQRFHHPKEDEHLFKAVRMRTREGVTLLAELEAQHAEGDGWIRNLRDAIDRLQASGGKQATAFAKGVDTYADFHWDHMRLEEDELIPLAQRVLLAEDWKEIDAAFSANDDPLFGTAPREEFASLRELIMNQAPAPSRGVEL